MEMGCGAGIVSGGRPAAEASLVDLADAWTEVPESTVVEMRPGEDEFRPFTPCR